MKRLVMLFVLLTAFAVSVFALPANATLSQLNQIPTADVMRVAKFRINFDYSFTAGEAATLTSSGNGAVVGAVVGIFPRFEVGATLPVTDFNIGQSMWDVAPMSKSAQFEFKFNVLEEGLAMPGVSVGMRNVSDVGDPNYFLVVSKHFTELIGAHVGVQGNTFGVQDELQPFAGVNAKVIPGMFEVMADWQNNGGTALDQGVLGVGVKWQFMPMFEVIAKGFFINGSTSNFDNLYVLEAAWTSL